MFSSTICDSPVYRDQKNREARRLFKEIDIDGSGFISPDEILGQTDTPAVYLGLEELPRGMQGKPFSFGHFIGDN